MNWSLRRDLETSFLVPFVDMDPLIRGLAPDSRAPTLDIPVWGLKGPVLDLRALAWDLLRVLVKILKWSLEGLVLDLLALDLRVPILNMPM